MSFINIIEIYQKKVQSMYPFEIDHSQVHQKLKLENSNQVQESSFERIIDIENFLMKNNFETALELWMSGFQLHNDFIQDTVLLGLFVNSGDFDSSMDIKIHWQKTLDKIIETHEIIFFKALYFTYLGQLFIDKDEFEISNAYLTKATLEFRKLFSNDEFIGIRYCQYRVAKNYTLLGASGEARYHYRELLDTFSLSSDEAVNYSWFVYLSNRMSKNDTKTIESLYALIKQLSKYPKAAYPQIRNAIKDISV